MCGIAVLASLNVHLPRSDSVVTMLEHMRGRGDCPPKIDELPLGAFGCIRLRIVDPAGGAQPVFNEDRTVAVVFNGELYNYRSLAATLEKLGHRFQSKCDTEVLVHGYEEWGGELLSRLEGMYAFVVLDQPRRRVFAARDPFGIKPLYYSKMGDDLLFASEMKALLKAGATDVRVVPPGGFVDNGAESPRLYFPHSNAQSVAPEEAKRELRERLARSVRSMLQTELSVAILCGGGIDSSAVLYEAAQTSANFVVYAIGTSAAASDVEAARRLCEVLQARFRPVIVSEEELLQSVPQVIATIESFEPNHIRGGTLSYALARAVHEDGIKVALCGEGADELLAGYPEFQDILNEPDFDSALGREIEGFTRELHKTQLQRVDRTNMAWSVEVRVPFLAIDFATYALSLPAELKVRRQEDGSPIAKWILREAYRGFLPNEIVDRPKLVLSEGAGVGDNSPSGPFFEHANKLVTDDDFSRLQAGFPQFDIQTKEEAYYFQIFQSLYGPLSLATERPRVNCQPTRG